MPRRVGTVIYMNTSSYGDVITASVADRGEKLELLIDKTEDLSSNVSYYIAHQLPELEWGISKIYSVKALCFS